MRKHIMILLAAVGLAFAGGLLVRGWLSGNSHEGHTPGDTVAKGESAAEFYTCSMHPHIRQVEPGACPLCGMDLIPVHRDSGGEGGPRELTMSMRARRLAELQTAPVERKFVTAQIRVVGKVEYDETRLAYITAWVPGRLDRLYVDYTGVPVKKGDHLVYLYSPELLQAQEELLSSVAMANDLQDSSSSYLKDRATVSVESAREKLRLWGLSESQITEIEEQGAASDHITINSPIAGVVVHKDALEGMYVQTGTQIYTIADLTEVWVKLDAYESDLPWLHYGQEVEFRTEAYPGDVFKGQIAFIDPMLNPRTRTVKIRVNVPNRDGKLKPEMFVRAVVKSQVAKGGRVMDPGFAGKWIGPMHPEIIKDEPGKCDICQMSLVSAESLGYVAAETDEAPLVIPASAPLITGKRAVVYVETSEGTYEGRDVELGPRAGDYYLVEAGLAEGERVVTKGNFKIDSAIQILAKPSMMNPSGGQQPPGHHHPAPAPKTPASDSHDGHDSHVMLPRSDVPEVFQEQLSEVVSVYLEMHNDLSHDAFAEAKRRAPALMSALEAVDMSLVSGDAHMAWMKLRSPIQDGGERISNAENMVDARQGFEHVSNALIETVRNFGTSGSSSLFVYHCPMAFPGRGGDWIQDKEGVENPYHGSKMFTCGTLKESVVEVTEEP